MGVYRRVCRVCECGTRARLHVARGKAVDMRLQVNRRSRVPMYRQLAEQLREQIVSGELSAGYRLPPERELAARLEVNRTTVLQAYQQLKDEGLIASRVGRGTFVLPSPSQPLSQPTSQSPQRLQPQPSPIPTPRPNQDQSPSQPPSSPSQPGERPSLRQTPSARHAELSTLDATLDAVPGAMPSAQTDLRWPTEAASTPPDETAPGRRAVIRTIRESRAVDAHPEPNAIRPPWSVLFSDYSNRFTYHDIASAERAQRADGTMIDFAAGSPNPADIPDDLLRAVSLEAFSSHEFDGQPESPIEGFDELRELLAEHMRTRGVHCKARNVMVLSGCEQGIDLCVRAFINPGDCVLVEQSTFFPALQSFRSAGARIVGVPMDGHGMRADLLEGYCARFHPKFIYTIPTFQNPTGSTMPSDRRRRLIDAARRHQCLIIEDDAYGELRYGDECPIPLAGMENEGYVLYLSTFSKTVTSGLRTGWIVADPHVIGRLAALRCMVDQHTSTSSQRICMQLLREGRIAGHVRALAAAYRDRCDTAIAAFERYAPHGMRWSVPEGGYYVWVTLPDGVRALDALAASRAVGVTFMPGGVFDVDETDDAHIRLNVVHPDPGDIETGIRRICATVTGLLHGQAGR